MRNLSLILAFACVSFACKDKPDAASDAGGPVTTASAPAASVTIATSALAGRPRSLALRASGVTGALFRSASTLELKDEQKTVLEKLATDFREADKAAMDLDGGARTEMKEAHDSLIAGVKAGKMDASKLTAQQATVEKLAKARHDREADALSKLHATLEPAQRTAAVAAIRAQDEKRAARMKARAMPDGGKPNSTRMRVEHYTKDLALDAEQQKKADVLLPKDEAADPMEEAKKKSDAVLAAFEKQTFEGKTALPFDAKKASGPMNDLVKYLGQLVPILKPEQREKLAAKLEKASDGRPGGRPRGMGSDRPHEIEDDEEL